MAQAGDGRHPPHGGGVIVLALIALKAPVYCAATVRPAPGVASNLGLTRKLRIEPVKSCPKGGVVRAHKVSLMNAEAPFRPVIPTVGAWTSPAGSYKDVWVGRNWRVRHWNRVTRTWVRTPAPD